MAKTALDLKVTAQDQATPILNKVRNSLNTMGGIRGTSGKAAHGGDPILAEGIRMTLALNALRGSMDLASAGINMIRGDFDAVGEVMQRLPLGIGALWRSMDTLWNAITDAEGKLERASRRVESAFDTIERRNKALVDKINKQWDIFNTAKSSVSQIAAGLQGEADLAGLDEYAAERRKAQQRFDDKMTTVATELSRVIAAFGQESEQAISLRRITDKAEQNADLVLAAELNRIQRAEYEEKQKQDELLRRAIEAQLEAERRQRQSEAQIYRVASVGDQPRLTGLRQAAIESGIVNQQVTYAKQTVDTLQKMHTIFQELLRRASYTGVMPGVFE